MSLKLIRNCESWSFLDGLPLVSIKTKEPKMSIKQLIIKSLAILLLVCIFVCRDKPSTSISNKKKLLENVLNQNYIMLENTNSDYILKMIAQYGGIYGDTTNQVEYSFEIGRLNKWYVIKVDSSLSNYEFYNLQTWFYGYEERADSPTFTIGYHRGNEIENKSYLFFTDRKKTACDVAVGVFSTNENFSIYLPEAYKENCLKINEDTAFIFSEIISELRDNGLGVDKIENLDFEKYRIKFNKSS